MLVATNLCHDKVLLQQNILSRQKFCHNEHTLVETKIILVAAPTSDTNLMEGLMQLMSSVDRSLLL